MMDKKSANGLQTKVSEGDVQRKQLPYSVETPYGFHLDLDFLKYVDDIEKGNTIKRVHIQRRLKGPPKFSTLPRNFSLPGHGARPVLKEKEIAWTGTSTLGPKPKSRLTEVQQVLDFRASEGGISSRGTTGQGYVYLKPKEEVATQGIDEKNVGLQGRPNLLRASSMPVTLQQRKGSDSSSPDRVIGTPENGSTENVFRASPDITERRVPHDRIGLHQQITVALKRVRELEEQVKTIPELKAQIASLRSEREQLLRQLQAQAQALVSASPPSTTSGSDAERQTQSQRSKQGFNLPLVTTSSGDVEASEPVLVKPLIKIEKDSSQETSKDSSARGSSQEQLSLDTDTQEVKSLRIKGDISNSQDANITNIGTHGDPRVVQSLNEQLKTLEANLSKASEELERANLLLKEKMAENKLKEEKIQQLSGGLAMEVCGEAQGTPRRESIDTGTVTEKIDLTHQETETEPCGTVDQGTDTERICIEVHVPQPGTEPTDQEAEGSALIIVDRQTDIEVDVSSPPRPRANSMERGTATERVVTQDQTTETPVTERVNQVTETEEETVNNHPHRPRASSVDRGTETERVRTVDRVTETEVAQRSNQQTETEVPHDNNPARETENQEVTEGASSQPANDVIVVGGKEDGKTVEHEKVVGEVVTDSLVDDPVKIIEKSEVSDVAKVEEGQKSTPVGQDEAMVHPKTAQNDSETKENIPPESVLTETVEKKQVESEIVRVTIKETVVTDTVVITAESPAVKTVVPVRPQRGRRPSGEQVPTLPPPQPAPVRPRRGSSEKQGQQPKPETEVHVQEQKTQIEAQPPEPKSESLSQIDKLPEKVIEKQPPTEVENKREVQTLPKSAQAQTSTTRRNSKELKALQKGSSVSLPSSRGSGGNQTRPTRQGSSEVQPQTRRKSSESQPPTSEARSLRRGSSEAGQRRGSGESQATRRGSGESPTSPAALGQVVTRLTGLLGEQWAQLGSSSGAQQTVSQQETPAAQKQAAGKRAEASKGASAKSVGKAPPAASEKPAGKPAPSKMSSIQSQLVSSLSVLSAFYSPAQKAAAANKQQERGLKSIMKKNGSADKPGSKGAKKNLKFVGVNGGRYETTSSEESSGDEKTKAEEEEEDSSEPEVEKESEVKPEEGAAMQKKEEGGAEEGRPAAVGKESERVLLEPESSQELLEELAEEGKVDKGFIDACLYVKDRMEEVSSPDKEMRQVLVVLYQEWFKVSSQKDSQADTVRLYLRQVGLTTPTLLPYVVNLTDGNGNMALHYSVSHSNFSVVKLLLDTGLCETDNVNKAGYTPVMLAALTPADTPDDLEVVQQLLRLGDVNARSRQTGQTALMLAVSHGRLAMVKLLLSCGADVNAQDREGSTALMCASEHGHTHIASLLLETGRCDLSLSDKNGQTAQAVAEDASHQDIIDLLKSSAKTRTS